MARDSLWRRRRGAPAGWVRSQRRCLLPQAKGTQACVAASRSPPQLRPQRPRRRGEARRPLPPRPLLVVDRVARLQPQLAAAVSSRAVLAQLPPPRAVGVVELPVRLPQPLVRRRELDLEPSQLLAQHEDPVGRVPRRRRPPCRRRTRTRARLSVSGGFGRVRAGERGRERLTGLALRRARAAREHLGHHVVRLVVLVPRAARGVPLHPWGGEPRRPRGITFPRSRVSSTRAEKGMDRADGRAARHRDHTAHPNAPVRRYLHSCWAARP